MSNIFQIGDWVRFKDEDDFGLSTHLKVVDLKPVGNGNEFSYTLFDPASPDAEIKSYGSELELVEILERGKTEPKTKTTYRMANGDLIYGEYSYVGDLEFFEDSDEPTELVKETWVLVSSEQLTIPGLDSEDDNYEDDIVQADDLHRYSMGG
jgi:hypothetical protein